jgi:hypothetical protein
VYLCRVTYTYPKSQARYLTPLLKRSITSANAAAARAGLHESFPPTAKAKRLPNGTARVVVAIYAWHE